VGDVYTRAYTLCQQTGEAPQLARALWGLSQFHLTQRQLANAAELAQQLLALAERQSDIGFLREGHFVIGAVAVRLCRPSPTAESGGSDPGPAGGASPQSGVCGMLRGPRLPVSPRCGGNPGACRRHASPGRRAELAAPRRAGAHLAGVSSCHARRPPAWRFSARGWPLPTWDQSRYGPIGSPCWPRHMAGRRRGWMSEPMSVRLCNAHFCGHGPRVNAASQPLCRFT
jgi:hypothetical protein